MSLTSQQRYLAITTQNTCCDQGTSRETSYLGALAVVIDVTPKNKEYCEITWYWTIEIVAIL